MDIGSFQQRRLGGNRSSIKKADPVKRNKYAQVIHDWQHVGKRKKISTKLKELKKITMNTNAQQDAENSNANFTT